MGFSSQKAKKLVTTTRATLAQEVEQAAAQATTNQHVQPEEQPHEEFPINQELRQEGQVESMTQANTTLLSQMLGEVVCTNSMQFDIFLLQYVANFFFGCRGLNLPHYLSLRNRCRIVLL